MNEDMGEIKVESVWGAIASLVLLQIFGYVTFQIFLESMNMFELSLSPGFVMMIMGIGFLFIFIFFQSESFYKIGQFFSKNNINDVFDSLRQLDESIKFVLTLSFTLILILIVFGYYPFTKVENDFLIEIGFFIFSWFISYLVSKLRKHNVPLYIAKGTNRIAGIIFGLFFFTIGIVSKYLIPTEEGVIQEFQTFTYFLGMLGLGLTISLACSLLMEDQSR